MTDEIEYCLKLRNIFVKRTLITVNIAVAVIIHPVRHSL